MRIALIALLILAAAPARAAPAAPPAPAPAAGGSAFLGFDMSGYVEGTNRQWRECIKPAGVTSYWIEGFFDQGRVRVRDDGVLCFSYKSENFAREGCFIAERRGENWRFTDENDRQTVFVTTHTRKNVKACPTNLPPVS
jgi:hypothetical protein